MRLREFRVCGFRCIRDSGNVPVGDLAALIGKNESGKTALLQALLLLNKDASVNQLDLCDEMWEVFEGEPEYRIVEGKFELTEAESKAIVEHVAGAPMIKTVQVYRLREGTLRCEFSGAVFGSRFELNSDVNQALQAVLVTLRTVVNRLTGLTEEPESADASHHDYVPQLLALIDRLAAPDKVGREATLEAIETLVTFKTSHSSLAEPIAEVEDISEKLFDEISVEEEARTYLFEKLHPRLVYFSDYKIIRGAIKITQYLAAPGSAQDERLDTGEPLDKRETIDNLFYLARLDPKRLEEIKNSPSLKNKYLSECSDRLTKALRPTWISQPIDIELVYDTGDVLWARISDVHEDGSRTNKGPLNRRAAGFIWHFSFFINFTAETQKADLKDAVILLDEPGLHLHPAQQSGTLEVFKSLAKRNQIIYTTHSPFMIFDYTVGHLLTVERDPGTHVSTIRSTYWDSDPETLIPILHALGAPEAFGDATRAMSKRPVVVMEGITDYQYFTTMMDLLTTKKPDAVKLLANVEMVQANGSAAIGPLALFHRRRGKNVVALYDNEPAARQMAEELKKFGFPEDKIQFCRVNSKTECDVEDTFAEKEYLEAVNKLYQEVLKNSNYVPLSGADLKSKKQSDASLVRIVSILSSIWSDHKDQKWGSFDKKKVCDKMTEMIYADPKLLSPKTIERFAELFQGLTEAIHPPASAPVPPAD